jgi:hypothetical protein
LKKLLSKVPSKVWCFELLPVTDAQWQNPQSSNAATPLQPSRVAPPMQLLFALMVLLLLGPD